MKNDIKIAKNKNKKNIMNKRRGKVDLQYFSPNIKRNNDKPSSNIELNKINIKELSKLSDRPIIHKKDLRNYIYSLDKINRSIENNNYGNKYNKCNSCTKRNIVIFAEPPKKLSDYILKEKSNNKKKIYKLIFIEENDLEGIENPYKNNNISDVNDSITFLKPKKISKINEAQQSYNDIIFKNNNTKKKLSVNINLTYKMKKNLSKIIKIQSCWKGYCLRNLFHKELKIIGASKLYKKIYTFFFDIKKAYAKLFFIKLKKIYNSSSQRKFYIDNKKINKNDKIYVNKYSNKENTKNAYNNYIYKRKNKSPGNHSSFKKPSKNLHVHNLKTIAKKEINDNYDVFNNTIYKKALETEISHLIKYINKRAIFLHLPFLIYRLKILQKINLIEHRYNSLLNIIKIKEKSKLYQYLQKYKNNIFSDHKSDAVNNNSINTNEIDNNNDNSDYKIKINIRKDYLQNNNNLNNSQKKISILTKIISGNELKINKKLLAKYLYKWKKLTPKKIIVPNLRNQLEDSYKITKYKSTAIPKKKQIKIKKMKSNYDSMNSKMLSKSNKKNTNYNSFDSENINIKKMKVNKINVLVEPNIIDNKGMGDLKVGELITKKESSDNSYFISKVANISNKISNKINMYNCFKFWKKESNLK